MNLIYIGSKFYHESDSIMSSLYDEDGSRWDWGKVEMHLRQGESILIRPANKIEMVVYESRLTSLKRELEKEIKND